MSKQFTAHITNGYHTLVNASGQNETWLARQNARLYAPVWRKAGHEHGDNVARQRLITSDLVSLGYAYHGIAPDFLHPENLRSAGYAMMPDPNMVKWHLPFYETTWAKKLFDEDGMKYIVTIDAYNRPLDPNDPRGDIEATYAPKAQFKMGDAADPGRFNVEQILKIDSKISEVEAFFERIWTDMYVLHDKPYEALSAAPAL